MSWLAQSFASTSLRRTPGPISPPHPRRGRRALTCRYDASRGGEHHASVSRGAMNDCFIVGSGRSGTSMVAGLLAQSGYFMGNKLDAYYGDTNPKGFFEDPDINAINERILHPIIPRRPREPIGRIVFPRRSVAWSLWLTYVSPEAVIPRPAPEILDWIRSYTIKRPFCLKDPRFSYTLSIWREQAPAARFICVFREPNRTAQSMVKEARRAEYLRHFKLDYAGALRVWQAMYLRILERTCTRGRVALRPLRSGA